ANLQPARCVYATSESLRVRHHHFHGVLLGDFLTSLAARKPKTVRRAIPEAIQRKASPFELEPEKPVTVSRLFARLNEQLDENTIVIADIGDALFGATELEIHSRTDFISPAYYTSMGFAVPAALGACVAREDRRVVAVCGDGAFQM